MIEFAISLEIAALLLAAVGAASTWIHNGHKKEERAQRERHHREMQSLRERHDRERQAAMQRLRRDRSRAGLQPPEAQE